MEILIIILSVLGLLKLVSLFILCCIEIYYSKLNVYIDGIRKDSGVYKSKGSYSIIPSIEVSMSGGFLEISIKFICFVYYMAYSINKGDK